MKALYFKTQGELAALQYGEFAQPPLGTEEIRVQVRAAALNGFEPMMILGTTALKTPLPMIPSGDIAGEIIELGPEVPTGEWQIGDRVLIEPFRGTKMMGETALGGACEEVCAHHEQLIRIPDAVSFDQASCLQIAYGTAYRMLHARGKIQAGETVLILGATGGVGVACVQFAKQLGARVVACGSAAWKLERLRQIGADWVVDTSNQDLLDFVDKEFGRARVFGSGGVDVVVNYIGGESWRNSIRCIKKGGRLLCCGATAGYNVESDLRHLWSFERTIVGSDGWERSDTLELLRMVERGDIQPVIDSVRPLSAGATAVQDLYERRVFGKVILDPQCQ
jgi:alcohol dehydrogenase